MKKYLINNNSDNLILFFTGWGCDEFEFAHLKSKSDVLLLYEYLDLNLDFDFSQYKKLDLIAFSAGVFIASIFNFDKYKINEIENKLALDGNPYLFDEYFGLSKKMQEILYSVNEENADEFAKNYLVKTQDEIEKFNHSKRTIDSSRAEFRALAEFYKINKENIKNIFNKAIIGEDDTIFNVQAQKEFYKEKLKIIKDARHNPFFKIESYEEIFKL